LANSKQNIYLASDFHFGVPNYQESLTREKKVIRWLEFIEDKAKEIHLVGDIWDFWFEYKYTVPKGNVRLLGTLSRLIDQGIEIHFYTGNHDMWTFGYLEKEIGMKVYKKPQEFTYFGKKYLIGHGDGLGPGDRSYKMLKKLFANKFLQWCLARLHPNFVLWIASYFSKRSRVANVEKDKIFHKEEEWLYQYCIEKNHKDFHDFYIFGHRHLPINIDLENQSKYINLGEWINYCSYVQITPENTSLLFFESENEMVFGLN
jgi:UDP-2,3-diacylglucosamine hydrolase